MLGIEDAQDLVHCFVAVQGRGRENSRHLLDALANAAEPEVPVSPAEYVVVFVGLPTARLDHGDAGPRTPRAEIRRLIIRRYSSRLSVA